jgi:hypothetical protein
MTIIISLCLLLLIAYLFDLTAARTKYRLLYYYYFFWMGEKPSFLISTFQILPLLTFTIANTIGLILIVEGSLELELNRSKVGLIKKSSMVSFL